MVLTRNLDGYMGLDSDSPPFHIHQLTLFVNLYPSITSLPIFINLLSVSLTLYVMFRVHKGSWELPGPKLLEIHACIGNFLHMSDSHCLFLPHLRRPSSLHSPYFAPTPALSEGVVIYLFPLYAITPALSESVVPSSYRPLSWEASQSSHTVRQ
jgi:hypothetical protein